MPSPHQIFSTKKCRSCAVEKDFVNFRPAKPRRDGSTIRRGVCITCEKKGRQERRRTECREASLAYQRKYYSRLSEKRASGIDTPYFIYRDSKGSDRKKGREHDLTVEFIERTLTKGCFYCGETDCRMTLDRIDNTLGHLQKNVVPACIRCNYLRRDMPYEAWMALVPTVKEVHQKGLFGDWQQQPFRRQE